jgi:hypothetical protein
LALIRGLTALAAASCCFMNKQDNGGKMKSFLIILPQLSCKKYLGRVFACAFGL